MNVTTYDVAGPDKFAGVSSDQFEDGAVMNSWDLDGSATESPSETTQEPDTEAYRANAPIVSGRVWVGISGAPQGCTLTGYKNVDDAAVVLEQNGATILRRTPNLVVLSERAPKGEFKSVFAADEMLCENIVGSSAFASADAVIGAPIDDRAEK